ncbi:MAG: hypothetical protein ACJAVO_000866 [Parvibaculaceae bacterium]|jgi:hypothetical protein
MTLMGVKNEADRVRASPIAYYHLRACPRDPSGGICGGGVVTVRGEIAEGWIAGTSPAMTLTGVKNEADRVRASPIACCHLRACPGDPSGGICGGGVVTVRGEIAEGWIAGTSPAMTLLDEDGWQ